MVGRIARTMVLALAFALAACQGAQELPTLAPTMAPVSQPPTPRPTQVPATDTPPPPTATFTPSATPVVLTPQPTPLAGPGINITTPAPDNNIFLGEEFIVSGLVHMAPDQALLLTLISTTGHILDQAEPEISELNSWQAALTAPNYVSGWAEVLAQLVTQDGQVLATDRLPIMMQVNPDAFDRYLIMHRPNQAQQAVAGFNLFFDGIAQQPADSLVTISLWNEACQNRVAQQSFRLRGSGYWQGFVIVPQSIAGQVCAVAHFGEPGSDVYREAQVEIEVLPPDDERALGVEVGNPPPERQLVSGRSLLLYGTAYNAPDGEVLVSVLLENGRLLTEGIATADIYGYWELELFIPETPAGPAQIEASVGDPSEDSFAQSIVPIYIGEQ